MASAMLFASCGSRGDNSKKIEEDIDVLEEFIGDVLDGDDTGFLKICPDLNTGDTKDYIDSYVYMLERYQGKTQISYEYETDIENIRKDDYSYDISLSVSFEYEEVGVIYSGEAEFSGVLSFDEEGDLYRSDVAYLLDDLADQAEYWVGELKSVMVEGGYNYVGVTSVENVCEALKALGLTQLTWEDYWWDEGTFYVSDEADELFATDFVGNSYEFEFFGSDEEARSQFDEFTSYFFDPSSSSLTSGFTVNTVDEGEFAYITFESDDILFGAYYSGSAVMSVNVVDGNIDEANELLEMLGFPELER